jgi:hypothetical protein
MPLSGSRAASQHDLKTTQLDFMIAWRFDYRSLADARSR